MNELERLRDAVIKACDHYISAGYSGLDHQMPEIHTPRLTNALIAFEAAVRADERAEIAIAYPESKGYRSCQHWNVMKIADGFGECAACGEVLALNQTHATGAGYRDE